MKKQLGLLAISMVTFSIYSAYAGNANTAEVAQLNKMYNVTGFDSIVADGYFNLTLQARSADKAFVKTSSDANNPISIAVHNRTLYITSTHSSTNSTKQSHPAVQIQLPALQNLHVYGPVNVLANGIPSNGLALLAEGYGNIQLKNAGNIREIKQDGNNVIKITGIKSESLALYAKGFGQVTLQGQANNFYARLNHDATLQARDLVANHVTAQAKYNSHAYIYPVKTLRAFTDQSAQIYYYKHLATLTQLPTQSGNVLQMQW